MRLAQRTHVSSGELFAHILGNEIRAGHDCDILQHLLAAVAESRSLHCKHAEHPAQFVHDKRRESLAFYLLRDYHQLLLAALNQFFQKRQNIIYRRDFLICHQYVRVIKHCFHLIGIGSHIRRDIATIKLHSQNLFVRIADGIGIFNCHHAVAADLTHHGRD